MARRVNTKFVIILIIAVFGTVGLVGGAYWYINRKDPTPYIEAGDKFATQGQWRQAANQYRAALTRQQSLTEVIYKYIEALQKQHVTDMTEATNALNQMRGWSEEALRQEPADPRAFDQMLGINLLLARDFGARSFWSDIQTKCEEVLQKAPDHQKALKYRAVAQVQQMAALDLDLAARQAIHENLQAALQQNPDDVELNVSLARWHVMQSQFFGKPGQDQSQIPVHRNEARRIVHDLRNKNPQDSDTLIEFAKVIMALHQDERTQQLREIIAQGGSQGDLQESEEYQRETAEIEDVVRQLEAQAVADPSNMRQVLEVQTLIRMTDRDVFESEGMQLTQGLKRSLDLLETAVAKHPDNLAYRLELGSLYAAMRQRDKALRHFKEGQRQKIDSPPLIALRDDRTTNLLRANYADQLLIKVDEDTDAARKQALVKEVEGIIDYLQKNTDGLGGWPTYLRGKLDLINRQYEQAVTAIDQAIGQMMSGGQTRRVYIEALNISAGLHRRLGRLGTAAGRYQELVEANPGNDALYRELAGVYLLASQPDSARGIIRVLMERDPGDARNLLLEGQMHALNDDPDEAMKSYEKVLLSENATDEQKLAAELNVIQLFANNEQRDTALVKAEQLFNEDPANAARLRAVMVLAESEERRLAYLEQAQRSGMDPRIIQSYQLQMAGADEIIKADRQRIASLEDPMEKALALYILEQRLGNEAAARDALKKAEQLDANHHLVVEGLINFALADKDWDRVNSLIDRARTHNVDGARGMFYIGRLELEQGNLDRAATSFRQALDARPNFAQGWQMLGEVELRNNDMASAFESFNKCLEQDPRNVGAHLGVARIHAARGNHAEVLDRMKTIRRLAQNNATLMLEYLRYEQMHGDREVALKEREELARKAPGLTVNRRQLALLLTQIESRKHEALGVINKLIEDEGLNIANVDTKARILLMEGKNDEALAFFRQFLADRGDQATLVEWNALGRLLWQIGDREGSIQAYNRAIELEDPKTRPSTLELATHHAMQNDIEPAIALFRRAWEGNRENVAAGYQLVKLYVQQGSVDKAREILSALPQEVQDRVPVLILRSAMFTLEGKHDAAIELLERGMASYPNAAELYFQRAIARLSSQQDAYQGALSVSVENDFHKALTLNPGYTDARRNFAHFLTRQQRYPEAVTQWRQIIERNEQSLFDRISLANLLLQTNQYLTLNRFLTESRELFPMSPVWPRFQGLVAQREGKTAVALERYRETFELSPEPNHLVPLVDLYLQENRASDALALLDRQSEMVNRYRVLQAFKGRALAALNRTDEAKSLFRQALQTDNERELQAVIQQIHAGLGAAETLAFIGSHVQGEHSIAMELTLLTLERTSGNHQAALARIRRLDQQLPADSPARYGLDMEWALVLHFSGSPEQAVVVYQRILEKTPNSVGILNNLAFLLADELDRADEAMPYAQRARDLAGGEANVLDTYGWVQFKAGRLREARQSLETALAMSPTVDTYYHLGMVLAKQAETNANFREEARSRLTEALRRAEEEGRTDLAESARKRLAELGG